MEGLGDGLEPEGKEREGSNLMEIGRKRGRKGWNVKGIKERNMEVWGHESCYWKRDWEEGKGATY